MGTTPEMPPDRIEGSLLGLLIGDALGVPYEFHPPYELPAKNFLEFESPPRFERAHAGVPPGTWSDDGAQALVLLDSLLSQKKLDLNHFADGLVRWASEGYFAVDGKVFDIGIQTRQAIDRLAAGEAPTKAGPARERDNGNGSLMRVLPLALWHTGTEEELVQLAMRQSLPTHGHLRAQLSCAQYCLWVRAVLDEVVNPWAAAAERLQASIGPSGECGDEVARILDPANAKFAIGSGYVLDTLWSARAAFERTDNFEDCVRSAIAFGHDTDTTAAVAGGVAGAFYGLAGIPLRWRNSLRGGNLLQPLVTALMQWRPSFGPASSRPRTSSTHPLQIAELAVGDGVAGITICPGKKQSGALTGNWDRELEIDLAVIKAWGAADIVTLIQPQELIELQVEALADRVRALGMRWHHLPITDGQPPGPAFEEAWWRLSPQLMGALEARRRLVVHCKGGLGRAGTVAALLLMDADARLSAPGAIQAVRRVRPGAIESRAQEQYLLNYGQRPRVKPG